MSDIDAPSAPREGETLDGAKLEAYLHGAVAGFAGPITVAQFPKGHSNLTYLVTSPTHELVLRRPPFGSKVKSAHDMGREHRILSRLAGHYPAPKPLALCEDEAVLGATFYVMERTRGVILRKDLPPDLALSPADVRRLDEGLIDRLVELHALPYAAIGLGDLGKPEGYVERQIAGWTKRYAASRTDDVPAVDEVAAWLEAHRPPDVAPTLIHNDFKLDNVVLAPDDPTRIIAVLDWEMSTIGDPLMDLGTTLSYWLDPDDDDALQTIRWAPTTVAGSLTRRELAARYAERSGRDLTNVLFYYAFGLFKTSVVLQQIYYRYKQGLTKDPRFGALILGVHVLATTASQAIARGTI